MGWPKHKWGFIVMGPWNGPLADNGQGMFVTSSFAEVFLDRKVAQWLRHKEQKFLRKFAEIQKPALRDDFLEAAKRIKIVRIALPGTYAQFQIPGRLERE